MLETLPAFSRRLDWFVAHRPDHAASLAPMQTPGVAGRQLLAIADRRRLERVLKVMLDEREFLSPYGIRSLSRVHADHPFTLHVNGAVNQVSYEPAESRSRDFGGTRTGAVPCVSSQLPDHRGAPAVPPLLRRRADSRVPDRVRSDAHALAGCRGAVRAAHAPVPATSRWDAAGVRRVGAISTAKCQA
jgi:hypothetical protein